MAVESSACPSCGKVADREPYDIGDGPEFCCGDCDWCWGADGQTLSAFPSGLEVAPEVAPSITCPHCGRTSYHPKDIDEGYCGYCHWWTSDPQLGMYKPISEDARQAFAEMQGGEHGRPRKASRFALWRCRTLGWHPVRHRVITAHDGASIHAQCMRCGTVGLVDSQGNLF